MNYTTHPLIVIYPKRIEDKRSFVIEVSSSSPPFIVDNHVLVWALLVLPKRFTKDEAFKLWSEEIEDPQIADELWEFLTVEELVLSQTAAEPLIERMELWEKLNWGFAGVYHESTRDYPFVNMSLKGAFLADNERMKDYEAGWAAPDCYRTIPSLRNVPLKTIDHNDLRSLSDFQRDAVSKLSLIFNFSFGQRFKIEQEYDEQNFLQLECLRKTIPSGGGRHPTEVFLIVFNARLGLESGIYTYNVQNNSLDLLRSGDFSQEFEALVFEPLQKGLDAAVVFTSKCERAMWRYRESRSWRAILLDAGHAWRMFERTCALLDHTPERYQHFDALEAARFLGRDPLEEPVLCIGSLRVRMEQNQ